jgi:signal recognition particle subunit SRP68
MYMKASHAEENASTGITGSTRSHIISRLNKASKCARSVVQLLSNQSSSATNIDILEAQAYAHLLAGTEEFEKQSEGNKRSEGSVNQWNKCLALYAVARVIYSTLLKNTRKELYKDVLAGMVDPSIRYAAYQARIPRTVAISDVAVRHFPKSSEEEIAQLVRGLDPDALEDSSARSKKSSDATSVPDTITWRSRTANIVDAAIGQALASVSTAEARLVSYLESAPQDTSSKDRAGAYDDVLIASQDTADATRHAIEELEKEGVTEGDSRMQDLRVTSLAVNYELIGWRVGRNRVLIGADDGAGLRHAQVRKTKRTRKDGKEWDEKEEGNGKKLARIRERVVLYDAILQSIDSVKDLRGAVRDAAFIEELDAKRAYYQALKCLNLSYSHNVVSSPDSSKNSVALLSRAVELSNKSLSLTTLPPPTSSLTKLDPAPSLVESLNSKLQALLRHQHAVYYLHTLSKPPTHAAKTVQAPLVERLNTYPSDGVDLSNLVTYPPRLQPVPVKPLFLDVAWNYIDYPGTAQRQVEKVVKEESKADEQPKKKGWFGFGR